MSLLPAGLGLYLEGVLLGIVPVFFVGPVLFTLLNASVDEGFGAGARVALGIAFSDVVAIGLCALGLGPLLTHPVGQVLLSVGGGLILLGFGLVLALSARRDLPSPAASPRRPSSGRHFLAGFAVNFVNPFVFTFWIGALGGVQARHGLGWDVIVAVFGGMVSTILVTDLLKAAAAGALSARLGDRGLRRARGLSGALLALAGVWLLAQGLQELFSGALA